jgi:hypothetical protein
MMDDALRRLNWPGREISIIAEEAGGKILILQD